MRKRYSDFLTASGLKLIQVREFTQRQTLLFSYQADKKLNIAQEEELEMLLRGLIPQVKNIQVVIETVYHEPFIDPVLEDGTEEVYEEELYSSMQAPSLDEIPPWEDDDLPPDAFSAYMMDPNPEGRIDERTSTFRDLHSSPSDNFNVLSDDPSLPLQNEEGVREIAPEDSFPSLDETGTLSDEESKSPSYVYEKPQWQIEKEQELLAQLEKEREERIKTLPKEKTSSEGERSFTPVPGTIITGRAISAPVQKIAQLDLKSETQINNVAVEGEIFSVEWKEISDKFIIFRCNLTDRTSSLSLKKFFQKKKKEEIEAAQALLVKGAYIKAHGNIQYDEYDKQKLLNVTDMTLATAPLHEDTAERKRIELHMHTQYSAMDSVNKVKEMMKRVSEFGHTAVGITDHGVLQAYPEVQSLAKKYGIKPLYGVEGYLVDSGKPIVKKGKSGSETPFSGEFVFFDLETTGLSSKKDTIIEIAAVRIIDGTIQDTFSQLVNPQGALRPSIVELTGLTDEMLEEEGISEKEAVQNFFTFAGDAVLAAHNAAFDTAFLKECLKKYEGIDEIANTVIDTLPMAQTFVPELRSYKLSRLCTFFKIKNEHAHRALDDSKASAQVLLELFKRAEEAGARHIGELDAYKNPDLLAKKQTRPWHIVLYAKNQEGLRDLYELVSISHLNYFQKRPRIPRELLNKFRKNLILGSACVAGELYQAILDEKDDASLEEIASYYDYLEVQPLGNNLFLTRDEKKPVSLQELKEHNKKIIELAHKLGKPVCATGDVHFLNKDDAVFRAVLTSQMHAEDEQAPLYFRNTEEMLAEFSYLPEETAYEVVVEGPNRVASWIEDVKAIPDGTYAPVIEGAEEDIRNMCEKRAFELYGSPLPEIVEARMERELNSIIGNGYAVLYLIAQKLVDNSEKAGYLVGSRGSVGSSFVAMLSGITEVNSLPPHYICPNCKHNEFFLNSKLVGPDLPDKLCPECGTPMHKDGYDIPFETFLGFEGDKEPDIDLNFSGDNQADAHAYTEVLFGKGKTFRAGTISTLAEKTAYGYVKNYLQDTGTYASNAEIERLKEGCTGVKRTTGQHPGGIMVVPRDQEIYRFTPVQHPADDPNSSTITTHFDYHSISGRLLKLDILGHDDPTMLRILYENTGVDPRSIPLDDQEVLSLFQGTQALHFIEECTLDLGTAGVPEFGTRFTKQMVRDAKPKTLADLIRISGLSHGTDVWTNNAQTLVNNQIATIDEVISTRDDIMLGLIGFGLPPKKAFNIMEHVRKGKGLTDEEESLMREHDVPNWYIDSCKKIQYMFPKAHAAAYVIMAFRIAWYKINYPAAYYAAYFGIRAKEFDLKVISKGIGAVKGEIKRLEEKSKNVKLSNKEEQSLVSLELALEMYARGYSCKNIDLERSHFRFFIPDGRSIIPPFTTVPGLGESIAENIVREREKSAFISQDDLQERTKLNNTCLEALRELGCLKGLPQSNQLSLFDFF